MMRNVNSLLREFHSNFNRFVIVESQFTFHYRDKWLEMNSQNLLSIKNTKSIFDRFFFVAEILSSILISWENPFEMQTTKKDCRAVKESQTLCSPLDEIRGGNKIEKWFWSKIKGISDVNLFVYTTVWSDSLNNPKQSGSDEFIELPFPYTKPVELFISSSSVAKVKKWEESNDYCVMW